MRAVDSKRSDGCRWLPPHPARLHSLCSGVIWQSGASTGLTSVKQDKLKHILGFRVRQQTSHPPARTIIPMRFQEIFPQSRQQYPGRDQLAPVTTRIKGTMKGFLALFTFAFFHVRARPCRQFPTHAFSLKAGLRDKGSTGPQQTLGFF